MLPLADLCIEINSDNLKEIYSIFVADSNTALLEGLVSIINQEPTFEVVGTASSKSELEAKVYACAASLFLLDIGWQTMCLCAPYMHRIEQKHDRKLPDKLDPCWQK